MSHIAAGTVLSDSDVAKEMSHALAEVPDSSTCRTVACVSSEALFHHLSLWKLFPSPQLSNYLVVVGPLSRLVFPVILT